MTPEELRECRWHLLYRAEYSSRYHRRRAAFLTNLDTLFTLATIAAGASAFGDLVGGSPGWLAKTGAAVVTLISLIQAILRLGSAGMTHAQWLKRWSRLQTDVTLNTDPNNDDVKGWTMERASIEEDCVTELRALVLDCEDAAARVLGLAGRQHRILPLQRLLIHFGTFQQKFPYLIDAPFNEGSPQLPRTEDAG